MNKNILTLAVILLSFTSISCGYTTSSALSSNLKTVYIENFTNKVDFADQNKRNIYIPLLEVDVRNAVIDRFLFDGNLRVSDPELADLVLKGELIRYERQALRYTDNDDVQEYRIQIYVRLEMWDNTQNEAMWSEPLFVGEETYFITGPLVTSEESAIDGAIEDLARRIVERTIENW